MELATCCKTVSSASCLQRRLKCGFDMTLKSAGGRPLFLKHHDYVMVSSILKLSPCGFGIDSDDVRKSAFRCAQSNEIKSSFSVNNKCRVIGSKDSVSANQQ